VQADLIYTGSLANSNEALYLFDDDCQLQDTAVATPNWPAGDNKTKQTMERTTNFYGKHQRRRAAHLKLKIPPIDFNCLSSDTYCEDAKVAKVRPSLARSNLRLDAYINLARWDKRCKKKTAVIF